MVRRQFLLCFLFVFLLAIGSRGRAAEVDGCGGRVDGSVDSGGRGDKMGC